MTTQTEDHQKLRRPDEARSGLSALGGDEGQSVVEWTLILVLVGVACVVVLELVGLSVLDKLLLIRDEIVRAFA